MTFSLAALLLAQAATPSPAATPVEAFPSAAPEDAIVRDSGSTNAAGYTLVIARDGTTDVVRNGTSTRRTLAHPQTAWLFAKLDDDVPVDGVETGRCMRSASFGTVTRITYRGATTGDLQCSIGPRAAELKRTIAAIAAQLGIAATSFRRFKL